MRQGYAATGMKQIVEASRAPFGSIYHFFPGGKEELGEETIRAAGAFFGALFEGYLGAYPDLPTAVAEFFDGAAEALENTGYTDACPIETIALEVASTNDRLRRATADVFEGWVQAFERSAVEAGMGQPAALELGLSTVCALEGAFILSRAQRSTAPMAAARNLSVAAIERELATSSPAGP